jgi:hypothetical protein
MAEELRFENGREGKGPHSRRPARVAAGCAVYLIGTFVGPILRAGWKDVQ